VVSALQVPPAVGSAVIWMLLFWEKITLVQSKKQIKIIFCKNDLNK
jgi:hypothetical protein